MSIIIKIWVAKTVSHLLFIFNNVWCKDVFDHFKVKKNKFGTLLGFHMSEAKPVEIHWFIYY